MREVYNSVHRPNRQGPATKQIADIKRFYEAFLTVSDFRPFLRRAASTRRPPGVEVRSKNPWVRALFRLFGWYVTDIMVYYIGIGQKMQGVRCIFVRTLANSSDKIALKFPQKTSCLSGAQERRLGVASE